MADQNSRLELWLKFLRPIIISGVFGSATAIAVPLINAQVQNKELEIAKNQKESELDMAKNEKDAEIRAKRLELEQKYVTTFLERATEENVENRFRFTRYLSALTLDPELKEGWAVLFRDAEKERSEKTKRLKELSGQTDEKAKKEIARLQIELEVTRNRPSLFQVISVPLSAIQENEPCPKNTKTILSAFESREFGESESSTDSFKSVGIWGKFANLKFYNIGRWCLTEDDKAVGDVVTFGATGKVISKYPAEGSPIGWYNIWQMK